MGSPETRERIVDGAADAFTRLGLADATVQDVLVSAGVSRRTFYQYFQSREDVLSAVYGRKMDELLEVLTTAIAAVPEPAEKVVATLDSWLAWQLAGGRTFLALQIEAIRPGSLLHARREAALDAIAGTIDEGVRTSLSVGADPLVYRGLVLGIEGLVLHLSQGERLAGERARLRRVALGLLFAVLANVGEMPTPPR